MAECKKISELTDEQKLALELEGIFSPDARKRRNQIYLGSDGDSIVSSARFIHYTSADAALKIIATKRVWMRNTNAMSDYREVQHGFDILNKFFRDPSKQAQFVAALDECVPGAANSAIQLFNQHWNTIRWHTYVASISEHESKEDLHGRLSMWRAFGGNSARVGIVLNIPGAEVAGALKIIFSPILYLDDHEADEVVPNIISNINAKKDFLKAVPLQTIVHQVFATLLVGVTCVKHEGFREEREWRAIYLPNIAPSDLIESSIETIAGVPQKIYKLPLDETIPNAPPELEFSKVFDRLIIGPSQYPWPMYNAFVEALIKAGVDATTAKDKVRVSEIPIRT